MMREAIRGAQWLMREAIRDDEGGDPRRSVSILRNQRVSDAIIRRNHGSSDDSTPLPSWSKTEKS